MTADNHRTEITDEEREEFLRINTPAWSSTKSEIVRAYETRLARTERERDALKERGARLEAALNERDLFINPGFCRKIANEIDCDFSRCENSWHEYDTNASGCSKSERGEYCPNDLAETLRAIARVSRAREALADKEE